MPSSRRPSTVSARRTTGRTRASRRFAGTGGALPVDGRLAARGKVHNLMTCSRRVIGWLLTLLVSLVAAPAALGATPAQRPSRARQLGATPAQQAVAAVRQFLATHGHGCPHFTVQRVRAHATTAAEVSDTRPAGFDVIVQLTRATGTGRVSGQRGTGLPRRPRVGCARRRLPCHPADAGDRAGLARAAVSQSRHRRDRDRLRRPVERSCSVNHALPTFAIQFPEGDSSPVWAATCSAHKQTVKFERTVYLLGPPDSLSFLLDGGGARRSTRRRSPR